MLKINNKYHLSIAGTTRYRNGTTQAETSLKRYKYVYKELDNETGLYNYGMRFYAPHIARFVSVDPLQFDYPDLTSFQYASNAPISHIDLDGLEKIKPPGPAGADINANSGNKPLTYNSSFLSLPQGQIRDRTQSHDNFQNLQMQPPQKIHPDPQFSFGRDKPFIFFGFLIAHANGYYEGKVGFYERGGGAILVTTMITVASAGLGGGLGGGTNMFKGYFSKAASFEVKERVAAIGVEGTVNYFSNANEHGWGWKNFQNHNLTGYLSTAINPDSGFSNLVMNTYFSNLGNISLSKGHEDISSEKLALELSINTLMTSITGIIDGGMLLKEGNLKDEVEDLYGMLNNFKSTEYGSKTYDTPGHDHFYLNLIKVLEKQETGISILQFGLGVTGGTSGNYLKSEMK